ncbi:hypothetical protein ACVNP3_18935 [Pseudomonas chlororaphis subsp. piscium]
MAFSMHAPPSVTGYAANGGNLGGGGVLRVTGMGPVIGGKMSDMPDGAYTHHDGTKADIYVLSSPTDNPEKSEFRVSVKFPGGAVAHAYGLLSKEEAYKRGLQIAEKTIEEENQRKRG